MVFHYSVKDKIDYIIIGNGKTKLLFLHGFGASYFTWDYIINLFDREKYTIYLVNLLGHGYSSHNYDSDYSIESQASIVKKFIEFLKINDLIIIGHSYGGSVSLLLIILHKEFIKVRKLILIDVGAFPDEIPFFVKYLRNPLLEFFIRIFIPKNVKAYYTLTKLYFDKDLISEERIKRYSKFYCYKQWKVIVKAAKQIIPINYKNIINDYININIPVLIIWGQNDKAITLNTGKKLNIELSNSKLEIINKCGHIPHEEKPEETFRLITDFLKS